MFLLTENLSVIHSQSGSLAAGQSVWKQGKFLGSDPGNNSQSAINNIIAMA